MARFHEWAWGYVTIRTVCGLTGATALRNAVSDLDNVEAADRCLNCMRMREAIGVSGHRAREGSATAVDRPRQSSNGVEACATAPASTPADPVLRRSTINELMLCANSWEPSVCLLGDVTARELRLFCIEFADMKRKLEQAQPVLDGAKGWLESWEDAEARPEASTLPAEAALYDAVVAWRRACGATAAPAGDRG